MIAGLDDSYRCKRSRTWHDVLKYWGDGVTTEQGGGVIEAEKDDVRDDLTDHAISIDTAQISTRYGRGGLSCAGANFIGDC